MKLYAVKPTRAGGLSTIGPVWSPDGVRLDDLDAPSPYEINHGVVRLDEVLPLGDRLMSVRDLMVVSEQARRVLEPLAPPEYLYFLPTRVMSPDGKEELSRYFSVITKERLDAIDYDRSEFVYFHGLPDMIRNVTKWSFREDALPPFELFLSKYGHWIGTQRAVWAIETTGLTGFECKLIWESDD